MRTACRRLTATRHLLPQCSAANLPTVWIPAKHMSTWDGRGSQEEYMQRDMCILVDANDTVQGGASKHDAHQFVQGSGPLHRAFSVFLFNSQSQLLLQQRALSKVTFPGMWTNTCCSHQLLGQEPSEVDGGQNDVASGTVPGARHAAVRKLLHELGIPSQQVPLANFKFLTRLHYCAPDTHTWGPDAPWGEHEMDYILFVRADVDMTPNPDEVNAVRYVTAAELREMMQPDSGLQWSPWFRLLADNFLDEWWADLDKTMAPSYDKYRKVIHRLAC